MSNDTGLEEGSPDESEVIRGLRADVKKLNAAVKTAGTEAIAKVERSKTASSLMPKGFEGFADIFESEVDDELTQEAANAWLAGRGLTAPSDVQSEEATQVADALEEVTNLGGAVAAAGNLTPEDSVLAQLGQIVKPGTPQSLEEVTLAIEKVING